MVRSLWTAATGMNGQQANIDAISNNLSNVNTTGFKQQRVEFEDLIYQNLKISKRAIILIIMVYSVEFVVLMMTVYLYAS